jgi:hypothetical protein
MLNVKFLITNCFFYSKLNQFLQKLNHYIGFWQKYTSVYRWVCPTCSFRSTRYRRQWTKCCAQYYCSLLFNTVHCILIALVLKTAISLLVTVINFSTVGSPCRVLWRRALKEDKVRLRGHINDTLDQYHYFFLNFAEKFGTKVCIFTRKHY